MKAKQDATGFWSSTDYPAITGLVLKGLVCDPNRSATSPLPPFVQKGYAFLEHSVKPDGGIYGKGLANYNTCVAMMALSAANDDKYNDTLRKARKFLVSQQNFYPKIDGKTNPYEGGIGYGDDGPHSDVSNTAFALEALQETRWALQGGDAPAAKDLNWDAAITFLQHCQNLPQSNPQPWATGDAKNHGGFIYTPVESHADDTIDGKTIPRSYGSMSYSGLLSYIYADLQKEDPRVVAVCDWLGRNYSVEENPGLGSSGLFYYYHTMAKALAAYGADKIALSSGKSVDWRAELALKLIDLQSSDGFWINQGSGRWWEKRTDIGHFLLRSGLGDNPSWSLIIVNQPAPDDDNDKWQLPIIAMGVLLLFVITLGAIWYVEAKLYPVQSNIAPINHP